jgi:uncharacterized membrane protein
MLPIMAQSLKLFGVALAAFVVLDAVWLGLVMRRFYRTQLSPIARMSGGALAPIWPVAALVYVLLAIGVVAFALPRAAGLASGGAMWGALLGIVIYGVYNLTNYSTLARWPSAMTIVDIAWGGVACAAVAAAVTVADSWIH